MKTAVVGLGNVLLGDDAFGPYVVRLFQSRYDTGDVDIVDLGTPGLDLAPHLEGLEALVVVDTISAGGPPGTVRMYRKDELLAQPAPIRTNPHQPGVKETLMLLDLEGGGPSEVLLIGAVPDRVDTGVGLSPALRDAVYAVMDLVVEELTRLGHPPALRPAPGDPEIWWERPRRGVGTTTTSPSG